MKNLVTIILVSAVVALLVVLGGGRVLTTETSSHGQKLSLYDQVRASGKIRAAYYVGDPYFMKDPNTGKLSGIFFDAMEEIGAQTALKVEWTEEVGFGEMIEGLNSGRFDVVASGIWINAARGQQADFTVPILYDAVGAFVREDDHRFDENLNAIDSSAVKISTIDGEMAATIAKSDFPKASVISLPQMTDFTQMILNVVNKKADVTFLGIAPAVKFQNANPGTIRNITPARPVRIFPTAIMIPRDQYAFKRMMDIAIMDLQHSGQLETIIRRYEELPGSHFRPAPDFVVPAK